MDDREASARSARDMKYFIARLDDRKLLKAAVVLEDGTLAVPAGGKRHGGYVCVSGIAEARAVIALLEREPGFPNLRYVPSHDREVAHNVRWGDKLPRLPRRLRGMYTMEQLAKHDIAEGRFYGYSDQVIFEHIREHFMSRIANILMPGAAFADELRTAFKKAKRRKVKPVKTFPAWVAAQQGGQGSRPS